MLNLLLHLLLIVVLMVRVLSAVTRWRRFPLCFRLSRRFCCCFFWFFLISLLLARLALTNKGQVGNIEYKLHLTNPGPHRLERLTTQMKWRLAEGGGEALYEIGVADDGTLIGLSEPDLQASLRTLQVF